MEAYKGRTLQPGQKVDVYRNLNTGNFSILCNKSKKVLAHAETVQISYCTCHVQKSGREKTITEKRKRVHAWISGTYISTDNVRRADLTEEVHYNPYLNESFVTSANEPVERLPLAHFEGDRVYSQPSKLGGGNATSEQILFFEQI